MTPPTFKLLDGNTIPAIAYGAGTRWFKYLQPGTNAELIDCVTNTIKLGFNHIDGAEVYNTDIEVGEGIKKSGVDRSTLFITDKYFVGVKGYDFKSPEPTPYDGLKASLARYQLEYVDLYLLHSQFIKKEVHGYTLVDAWKLLEKLKDEGLAKSIGVSNFSVEALKEILESNPKYKPTVNQIEFSANLQNQSPGIVKFCQDNGIVVSAFSSLAPITNKNEQNKNLIDYLNQLAKKYNKTEDQVLLRWVHQQKVIPVTTSNKEERIKNYLEIFSFELSKAESDKISELGSQSTIQIYPEAAP